MSLVGLNIGTHDSLSAKTRRYADYYRQLAAGTIKEVYDDETVRLFPCFRQEPLERATFTKCTVINSAGLYDCQQLASVDFPELISTGPYAFYRTKKLKSVFLPKVADLGVSAFYLSGVETVELPSCVTLRDSGFLGCTNLKEIKIPVCKTIFVKAFSDCSALEKIFLNGVTAVPTLGTDVFTGTPETLKIIVPDALVDSFKTATNWSTYAGRIIGVSEYEATQPQ